MRYLHFPKHPFSLVLLLLIATTTLFSSCGDSNLTNYKEKLIGEWELKNVGDLQTHYKKRPFLLKNATLKFNSNGTLESRMLSNRDKKTWITETATWTVTQSSNNSLAQISETLSIKADKSPFKDDIYIEFTDERTFYISLNELLYQFVKL